MYYLKQKYQQSGMNMKKSILLDIRSSKKQNERKKNNQV